MRGNTKFRFLLPVSETVTAIVVGGFGLWQRHHILSQPFVGDQTLWESTARFHVWPLPYRFAVISNIPAFLTAAIVEWPIGRLWPQLPEVCGFVLFVLFVPVLWYLLGSLLDKMQRDKCWAVLLSFTALAIAAMFTPGHASYILSGCLLWLAFGVVIGRMKGSA